MTLHTFFLHPAPAPLWTWLVPHKKSEAIRLKHPSLPSRSVKLLTPISTFSAGSFYLCLEPVPSWLLIITPVFITVHPCNRLSFFCLISTSIETCLCYLPFNAPLTPIYLLWLHVYMHTVATEFVEKLSPCCLHVYLSTPPPSVLNSLLLDFLLLDAYAYVSSLN